MKSPTSNPRTFWRLSLLLLVCLSPLANAAPDVIPEHFNKWDNYGNAQCGGTTGYNDRDPDNQERALEKYNEYKSCTIDQTYIDQCNAEKAQCVVFVVSDKGPPDHPYDAYHLKRLYWSDEDPEPECSTDTIPGGDINGGSGSGVYDVNGCAYTCGTNYSKLDGSTSMYDAQECSGLGQEYSSEDPTDYDDPPDQCEVRNSEGECLDMAGQEGGSCPSGSTYGQVNGTEVCVPSGSSTDNLDEGTQGPEGEGGDSPAGESDGSGDGDSDGSDPDGDGDDNTGGGDGDGEGDGVTWSGEEIDLSLEDTDEEYEQVMNDYQQKIQDIKNEVQSMFGTNLSGGGSVPDDTGVIKGVEVNFSVNRFLPDLSILGAVILFAAAFISAGILFTGRG